MAGVQLAAPRGPHRREGERGRRDDRFRPGDPRHGEGAPAGGRGRGGRPGTVRGREPRPDGRRVGDRVIYSKYGGTEVKVDGDEYLILSARDVLASSAVVSRLRSGGTRSSELGPRTICFQKEAHGRQAAQVRRGGPTRARGRRQQARRRGRHHARPQGPQRGARQEVGRAPPSRTTA